MRWALLTGRSQPINASAHSASVTNRTDPLVKKPASKASPSATSTSQWPNSPDTIANFHAHIQPGARMTVSNETAASGRAKSGNR